VNLALGVQIVPFLAQEFYKRGIFVQATEIVWWIILWSLPQLPVIAIRNFVDRRVKLNVLASIPRAQVMERVILLVFVHVISPQMVWNGLDVDVHALTLLHVVETVSVMEQTILVVVALEIGMVITVVNVKKIGTEVTVSFIVTVMETIQHKWAVMEEVHVLLKILGVRTKKLYVNVTQEKLYLMMEVEEHMLRIMNPRKIVKIVK
tara:strand:- start:3670 stop:4287 length:618 start_codon:yes stop_codon:yes gene_type:complete